MSRSKKLCILAGVLVIVCIAALIALNVNEKQEQIKTSGETVFELDPDKVTAVSWVYDGTTLGFSRTDDGWQYDDDTDFPVSTDAIDNLLETFREFGASFTIENADDLGQYGLDDPTCTITLTTDDETYTIKLGDFSTMDSQRYVDIGDGNVYLAASDPLNVYGVGLKSLIANDEVPSLDSVSKISFSGTAGYSIVYDADGKSICSDDVYFTSEGKALDTDLVSSYLSSISYLDLTDYVTYKASDADLESYGLDDPELKITVSYTDDDDKSGSFTLSISRDPDELANASDSDSESEEDADDITAYARVGTSNIVYKISGSSYNALMAAGYNDLRHKEIFSGSFDEVTSIDISLDGESYTLTLSSGSWKLDGEEIDISDLQSALVGLSAEDFTDEKASLKQEISLTLHLDNEDYSELTLEFYRYDGSLCMALTDGESTALVDRSDVVSLTEAVRAIVLD